MFEYAPLDNLAQDPEGRFIVTSTSLATYMSCPRKFWFGTVVRVREEGKKGHFTVGSVAHACVERHYLAGPEKIVPTPEQVAKMTSGDPFEIGGPLYGQTPGDRIDLFPPGWSKVLDRDGTWNEIEHEWEMLMVWALVHMAIDAGLLEHHENGEVERMFFRPLAKGLVYRSLIDYRALPHLVSDLKTTATRRYAKTPLQLAGNTQLMTYAYDSICSMEERGIPIPETLTLRHVQLIKRTMEVQETVAAPAPTPARILEYWDNIVQESEGIRELVEEGPHTEYNRVPGPRPGSGACQEYGGCKFLKYCHDKEPLHLPMNQPLSPAWWANNECPVCKGTGWNPFDPSPCVECKSIMPPDDRPENFEWLGTEQKKHVSFVQANTGEWLAKVQDPSEVQVYSLNSRGEFEEDPKLLVKDEPEPEPEPEPVFVEPLPEVEDKPKPKPEPKKSAGRPSGKVTYIAVGPMSVRGPKTKETYDLDTIGKRLMDDLAKEGGKDSYYMLDTWKRREALASAADSVMAEIEGGILIVTTRSPEFEPLLRELTARATYVFSSI